MTVVWKERGRKGVKEGRKKEGRKKENSLIFSFLDITERGGIYKVSEVER